MFTRDSALDYSHKLIHRLVHECARVGISRTSLCEKLCIPAPVLSMWITGARPCQTYWMVRNAELLLDDIKKIEGKAVFKK